MALAEKGLSREEAYALVQKHALDTWDELDSADSPDFKSRLEGDKKIGKYLSSEDLNAAFSLETHLAQVDFIFDRVFE